MIFFTALLTYLRAQTTITDKVPASRIYPGFVNIQTTTKPYIYLEELSNQGSHNRDNPDGVARPHILIEIVHTSYGAAHEIAEIVKTSLDGYDGVMGDLPRVECRYSDQNDEVYTESGIIYSVQQIYRFFYKE